MKSRVLRAGLLIAAVVLAPAACRRGGGDEILIGEYGSLTGTTATFGQSTNNAIQMAYAEINAAGGLLGKKVRVAVEDDQSKP
jgi:branched-chain amino acid transport system substrate-binding protein